jgi:perosamine synthetase
MDFKVPFSPRSQKYTEEEIKIVTETMRDAPTLTQGEKLRAFQEDFSKKMGVEHCFAVNSATSALELCAQLCQFEAGDEFICPSHTYTATAYPFIKAGGTPKWADIDIKTRVVNLDTIKAVATEKTKAIIVVHLYGLFCPEMREIAEYARNNGYILIEDVAQAIGTSFEGTNEIAGSFGDFSVFSFHSHKNITTLGEGGMLVVRNSATAEIIPLLRHNGHCAWTEPRQDYWKPAMGNVDLPSFNDQLMIPNNYCIGEVECALGSALLGRVDEINAEKRRRAIDFIDNCSNTDLIEFYRVDNKSHNYHLLVAKINNGLRDDFIRKMSQEKSVQCVVQYYPLNRYNLYAKLGFDKADCPNADNFFDNMVSFPFNHHLSDTDIGYVLEAANEILDQF